MNLDGRIIYVLKGWHGEHLYKIGCTANIRKRFPQRLRDQIVATIAVPDSANLYEAERQVQALFQSQSVSGCEAFALSQDDIKRLQTYTL